MMIATGTKAGFELLRCFTKKFLAFEGPISCDDIPVIFMLDHIPGTHSFLVTDFFLDAFLVI